MLKSKQFLKISKRGSVAKVVREHYLRSDIPCGVQGCPSCEQSSSDLLPSLLPDLPILVLDANVLLHQTDVVEHLSNVVLPNVALQETRNQSPSTYDRVRQWCRSASAHAYVFAGEHHIECYQEPAAGRESPNDYNDRSIRAVAEWYATHAAERQPKTIVFITSDSASAKESSVTTMTLSSWLDQNAELHHLREMVCLYATPEDGKQVKPFPPHLARTAWEQGAKDGRFVRGTLQVSSVSRKEATIEVSEGHTLRLNGHEAINRAIHGDSVVALPASDGTATVVAIARSNWRPLCGSVIESSGPWFRFDPVDRRFPRVRIHSTKDLSGKRLVVTVDSWPRDSRYPLGHVKEVLEKAGELATETEVLLREHDIRHAPFVPAVEACLPPPDWEGSHQELQEKSAPWRCDLRDAPVASIDPPGCTDIDDALHARWLSNEACWEVGVHIADVSFFLTPGTAMDEEAQQRATSVYLVDRRIDMLPARLGTDLCSLRENVDRLAFSCLWKFSRDFEVLDVSFTKSVIRSRRSFTYADAQLVFEDPESASKNDPAVVSSLFHLREIARALRQKRLAAGALTLASSEVCFSIKPGANDPGDVCIKQSLETNALVEEFMLLANEAVARKIRGSFPDSALLRRHPTPAQENFSHLVESLRATRSLGLHPETSATLSESLDRAVVPDDEYLNTLIRMLATRCMTQATYFGSGSVPFAEYRHYGLALPIYTHFTSPIRRYADVLVHRLLAAAIGNVPNSPPVSRGTVEGACENLNRRHRLAQFASRSSTEMFTLIYLAEKQKKEKVEEQVAYVTKIIPGSVEKGTAWVIFAMIPKFGVEARVEVPAAAGGPTTTFEESSFSLSKEGRPWIALYQKIRVSLSVQQEHSRKRLVAAIVE